MNKEAFITWLLLLFLTVISVILSSSQGNYIAFIILGLAVIKFFGVAFQFMKLKKAHSFWKSLLVIFITVFTILMISMTF